jgi:hypothetical protein
MIYVTVSAPEKLLYDLLGVGLNYNEKKVWTS